MLNELSNTVVFERPKEEAFVRKWQLACQGDIAHVVVMPNVTLDKIEAFVTDLVASRARDVTSSIQVIISPLNSVNIKETSQPSGKISMKKATSISFLKLTVHFAMAF